MTELAGLASYTSGASSTRLRPACFAR
jgi:hypothetical protein